AQQRGHRAVDDRTLGPIGHERGPRLLIDELGLEVGLAVLDQRFDIVAQGSQIAAVGVLRFIGLAGRPCNVGRAVILPPRRGDAVVLGRIHRRRRRARRKPASAAKPTAVPGLLRTNSRASSPNSSTLFWSSRWAVSCSLREAVRA